MIHIDDVVARRGRARRGLARPGATWRGAVILALLAALTAPGSAFSSGIVPLQAGEAAPFSGVLLSEAAADDAAATVLALDVATRRATAAEQALEQALATPDCPATWWGAHGWQVGLVGGAILGAVITAAIASAAH